MGHVSGHSTNSGSLPILIYFHPLSKDRLESINLQNQPRSRTLFYGWYLVAISALTLMLKSASTSRFESSVDTMRSSQSWAGARLYTSLISGAFFTAFLAPIEGFLVDRFGARRIVIGGMVLTGLGLILYSQVRTTWQFYAVYLIVSTGAGLGGWIAIATIINNWFVRRRTFALSLTMVGSQFIGFFIPLSLLLLLSDIYFRVAFPIMGLLLMCSAIPVARFLRDRPEDLQLRREGEPSYQPDVEPVAPQSVRSEQIYDMGPWNALATRAFWTVVAARMISGASFMLTSTRLIIASTQGSLVVRQLSYDGCPDSELSPLPLGEG